MENEEFSSEDFMYGMSVLLEGMLYFAGVKKKNLEKAAELYVEVFDDALEGSDASRVDEPIEVINYLKKHHCELFK